MNELHEDLACFVPHARGKGRGKPGMRKAAAAVWSGPLSPGRSAGRAKIGGFLLLPLSRRIVISAACSGKIGKNGTEFFPKVRVAGESNRGPWKECMRHCVSGR